MADFQQYRTIRTIGEGGMGEVLFAFYHHLRGDAAKAANAYSVGLQQHDLDVSARKTRVGIKDYCLEILYQRMRKEIGALIGVEN